MVEVLFRQQQKNISPKTKFLIEKGSEIIFNGIIMKGDTENVAEMFY